MNEVYYQLYVISILTSHITKNISEARWLSGLLDGRLDGFNLPSVQGRWLSALDVIFVI